jgi:hypothetical protein
MPQPGVQASERAISENCGSRFWLAAFSWCSLIANLRPRHRFAWSVSMTFVGLILGTAQQPMAHIPSEVKATTACPIISPIVSRMISASSSGTTSAVNLSWAQRWVSTGWCLQLGRLPATQAQ